MRILKKQIICISLYMWLIAGFATESIAQSYSSNDGSDNEMPTILSTIPADGDMDVAPGTPIEITFSSVMDTTSINATTMMLHASSAETLNKNQNEMPGEYLREHSAANASGPGWNFTTGDISASISYSGKTVVFTPDEDLEEGRLYTFTVTSDVRSSEERALGNDYMWRFTTSHKSIMSYADGQNTGSYGYGQEAEYTAADTSATENAAMIDLGNAARFVILAKENVRNVAGSEISGQLGEGANADPSKKQAEFTESARETTAGEVLVLRSTQSDSSYVDVSDALEDMMLAFRNVSTYGEKVATSQTGASFQDNELSPGVHEWSNSLDLESDITLSGSADDMWIFKVGENLTIHDDMVFTLSDGAKAENIFWYVEGSVRIGEDAIFKGILFSMNEITLEEGAIFNGRMFSQTSIALNKNTVTEPGNVAGQRTSKNR